MWSSKMIICIKRLMRKSSFHMSCRHLSSIQQIDKPKRVDYTEERSFVDINAETYGSLATDANTSRRIAAIISEYENEKYTTLRVPSALTVDHMRDLLRCDTDSERRKMFDYLFSKERRKINKKIKKIIKTEENSLHAKDRYSHINSERTGIFDNDGDVVYGLWHNTVFTRITNTFLDKLAVNKLMTAAMFGQKLVIDLDYDSCMSLIESRLMARQMSRLYYYNKYETVEPFDIHFTNCAIDSLTMEAMATQLPERNSPHFISQFHSNSYLDLFPKNKLVYITPHAKQSIDTFHANDIFIIGGLYQKSSTKYTGFIKAEKEGIRTLKMPIDENIMWSGGPKYLCLNHIIAILHDFKMSGDWRTALKHNIPKRKQKSVETAAHEDDLRRSHLMRKSQCKPNAIENIKEYTNQKRVSKYLPKYALFQ